MVEEDEGLLCPACGYDLRGASSDQCSECGTAIDSAALGRSAIPWARRGETGRVRAYLRTVWQVSVGKGALVHEATKRQDSRDAASFRRVTTTLFSAALLGTFAIVVHDAGGLWGLGFEPSSTFSFAREPGWAWDVAVPWSAGVVIYPVLPACVILLAIHLATVHGRLFHDAGASARRRQRGAALAAYASAPMAWFLVPVLWWVGIPFAYEILVLPMSEANSERYWSWVFAGATALLSVGRILQWAMRVRRWDAGRTLLGLLQLLGLWLLGTVVLLGFVPWCVGFLWIVIDSFR